MSVEGSREGTERTLPDVHLAPVNPKVQDEEQIVDKKQQKGVHDEEESEQRAEQRRKDAAAAALTLELIGDLPHADVKPPENVLFVCKLNPVMRSEDLELIFSRFGKICNCEVIKDKKVRGMTI